MTRGQRDHQRAMRNGDARFRTIFDGVNDAIFIHDFDTGTVLDVNVRAEEMYGLPRAEIIGSPPSAMSSDVPPYTPRDARTWLERARQGEAPVFEWHARHRDGHLFWVEVSMRRAELSGQRVILVVVRDIEERKRAEEALRVSEGRYRTLAEHLPAVVYAAAADESGSTLYVSPYVETMLGFTSTEWMADPSLWVRHIHPDDRERVLAEYVRSHGHGSTRPFVAEYRLLDRAGRVRWVHDHAVGVRFAPCQPPVVQGVMLDVTERVRAEEALRHNAARLEQAEAHARLGSWEFDIASGQGWWSPQMYALLRRDPADGVPGLEEGLAYLHPDDRAMLREVLNRMAAGETPDPGPDPGPLRSDPGCGPVRWFSPTVHCERDAAGRPTRLTGTLLDVTAIRQAEDALRANEARLRAIIDNEPECVKIVNAGGELLEMNPAGLAMVEAATLAQAVEQPLLDFVVPEHRAAFAALHRRVLEGSMGTLEFELVGLKGTRRWVDTHAVPLRDADGRPVALLGITRDITAARRAREVLRRVNTELEQRVAERTAQLEAANKELAAFSYSVSHDLKAPLRGIEGYSQLLLTTHGERLDGEARLFLDNIRSGVALMHELIEDLLAYSRMERRSLEARSLDVGAVVQGLLETYAGEIGGCGAVVDREVAGLEVRADREGLTLVLRNLLENALKFSRDARPPRIEIGARQDGAKAILWMRDNGIGFDMKYHDRIFDIFQRLHRAELYPGTGVGLALVRKAMQRMGGRVWAESAPGRGAIFYLELPR